LASRPRILITAAGGGHTGFAVAVAQHIPDDFELVFAMARGDSYSAEKIKKTLDRDYTVIRVPAGRGPSGSLLKAAPRLFYSLAVSLRRIGRVDAAVCTGHNTGVPPCMAARLRGARLVSLEDVYRVSVRSRSISFLARFSEHVALHWDVQKGLYPGKGVVVGPVYEPPRYEPGDDGYILVTAGSYGFEELFDVLAGLAMEGGLGRELVFQTGRVPPEKYSKMGFRAFSFDPDIDRFIARASIVITHQGMTAITSALGYGKPTLIVYNPRWRLAAPPGDVARIASLIGAGFVDGPRKEDIVEALGRLGRPKTGFPRGAEGVARLAASLATR